MRTSVETVALRLVVEIHFAKLAIANIFWTINLTKLVIRGSKFFQQIGFHVPVIEADKTLIQILFRQNVLVSG